MPFRLAVLALHGAVGWALCGASMGVGLSFTTLPTALAIHAVVAPIAFAAVSWVYFRYFAYTGPAATAAAFLAVVILLDVFVVALLIERSFAMFASPLGTWIPFALIFAATWITGRVVRGRGAATGGATA